jgi:uncharacterized phage protein (TIGR01671 family)
MREIVFRGKRVDTGEWIYGSLVEEPHGNPSISDHSSVTYSRYEVDPDTVSQYVGLPDKRGTKTFEDDIIREDFDPSGFEDPRDAVEISIVSFQNGAFGFRPLTDEWQTFAEYPKMQYVVIGNTTDTPELIKGTNHVR